MYGRIFSLLVIIVLMSVAFGCSKGGFTPTEPVSDRATVSSGDSHSLWGLWQFKADSAAQTLDFVPLRGTEMHINVLPFLEPPAMVNLTLESLEFNGDQITADIGLRHPFLGLTEFTGFDVCGVFITSGSISGFDNPDLIMAGEGDTRLLNPDGYTRWWNPAEFPVNTGTMFGYNDGLLGAPDSVGDFNSTLNGFKYYTDDLDPTDGLDAVDPANRGIFSAGQKNVRRFIIDMADGLVFNYAIDANWQLPTGDPPYEAPDDFPIGANRPEPWRIEVTELANTLWNDGMGSGGILNLSFDVYGHSDLEETALLAESPGSITLMAAGNPVAGDEHFSTYELDITDATPAPGSIDLLITLETDVFDYGGLLPGETVSAYFTYTADVGTESPITGVFVDGDNESDPLEDGSMSHPFDTVQEGINAAGSGDFIDIWDVYVDPYAAGDYALFTLADDVQVIGYAWAAGTGRPEIIITDAFTFADGATNCMLKNFLITFDHTAQLSGALNLFTITNTDGCTIEDCKFTGDMAAQQSTFINLYTNDNLTIEHNEFVAIRNRSTFASGYHLLYFMVLTACDDVLIRHNELHDIGYNDEGTSTTNNNTHTTIFSMRYTGGPPTYCSNVHFYNNLIYDITNYSDTSSTAVNYVQILGWNAWVGYNAVPGFIWANNTADDITEIADIETRRGNAFFCYGGVIDPGWIVKNSIISNMAPLSTAIYYNGHRGFWADSCVSQVAVTYSNCYNFGPVGHPQVRDYVNFFTKGVGSYGLADYQDPAYNMTAGPNWYHVTNTALLSDDSTEMGAFGGPYGNWTPPSQES